MSGTLLYLYTVLPAGDPACRLLAHDDVTGIDGGAVRAVEEGPLVAAVGEVPGADFDEQPLNRNLANLDWLGPRAAAHQEVNARLFAEAEALLPLSFGALFRSEATLRERLRAGEATFLARLAAVRGCSEWVVSLRREVARAADALETAGAVAGLRRQIGSAPPGRAFLLERRIGEVRRRETQAADVGVLAAVAAAVEGSSRAAVREPVVPDAGGQGAGAVRTIARLSALVERRDEGRLAGAVGRVREVWEPRGYHVEVSGPWPPYRFGSEPAPQVART